MSPEFRSELIARTRAVLEVHGLADHFARFPWLTGALGDPTAAVWFIAENPSLGMVERATAPGGGRPTEESQWYASRGDRLFRDMLHKYGFKTSAPDEPGGWNCYITNIIKEPDYAKLWRGSPEERRTEALRNWRDVFAWELAVGQPQLVVALGKTVRKALDGLERMGVELPTTETIEHYSYVALRPKGKLGPMHPDRIADYDSQFRALAAIGPIH